MYDYNVPKYTRWTITAVDCYLRNCNCQGCLVKEYFDKVTTPKYKPYCHMKSAVIALVKNVGTPTEEDYRKAIECKENKNATNTTI